MNSLCKTTSCLIFLLCVICRTTANGQVINNLRTKTDTDSLSLKTIIDEIVRSHPTVRSAAEALSNADARIGLAKTGYYPLVDLGASYSNIGPVIKLTIPDLGTFKLYPDNNYSAAINYKQVLYDFGRTRHSIAMEQQNKMISELTLEQVKQTMSLSAVNSFYTIAYLQEAVRIKDEQIANLKAHLRYVETMKATGSATDYQILSTRVRISGAESQKSDLLTSLEIQQAYLDALLGTPDLKPAVKEELNVIAPGSPGDSLVSFALKNRNEVLINVEKESLAGIRYQLIKSLTQPVVNVFASGGLKNGYIPDLAVIKPNYVVGIGISVPLFDGMRTKYNLMQAKSAINSVGFEMENTRRNITSEVKDAEAYMRSALQKISQFELQLDQALKASALAETSFKAGTVTNLELLDADTGLSESRLMLLKARIDYAASIYRLKAALGEKLY